MTEAWRLRWVFESLAAGMSPPCVWCECVGPVTAVIVKD